MKENIKLYDESGESISCEVIGSFYSEETNHCYIIFKKSDEKIYASRYILENNMLITKDIEEEKEWDIIDKYLENI